MRKTKQQEIDNLNELIRLKNMQIKSQSNTIKKQDEFSKQSKNTFDEIKHILDWFEYHNKNLTKEQFNKLDEIRYLLTITKG